MHQGRTPEGPRGGLLAFRGTTAAKGLMEACGYDAQTPCGLISLCQTLVVGRSPGSRSDRDRRSPAARRPARCLAGWPAVPPARRRSSPAVLPIRRWRHASAGPDRDDRRGGASEPPARQPRVLRRDGGPGVPRHGPLADRFAWHGSTPKRDVTKSGTHRAAASSLGCGLRGLDGPGAALAPLALFQAVAVAVHFYGRNAKLVFNARLLVDAHSTGLYRHPKHRRSLRKPRKLSSV